MPKKHQLFLQFDDGSALAVSVQMYGCLKVATEQEMQTDGYLAGQRLKPFVLSDAFTFSYFQSLVNEKTPKLSAKAFLATEQRIPGLGNGVLQDILFAAGVHPQRKMADVTSEEFANMYHAVKKVLKEMVDSGGRDVEKDLFGHPGGYKTILSQNTVHMPCHICGTPIQKKAYLGGAIYYCPVCQKIGKGRRLSGSDDTECPSDVPQLWSRTSAFPGVWGR